jgi:hypothetical protein
MHVQDTGHEVEARVPSESDGLAKPPLLPASLSNSFGHSASLQPTRSHHFPRVLFLLGSLPKTVPPPHQTIPFPPHVPRPCQKHSPFTNPAHTERGYFFCVANPLLSFCSLTVAHPSSSTKLDRSTLKHSPVSSPDFLAEFVRACDRTRLPAYVSVISPPTGLHCRRLYSLLCSIIRREQLTNPSFTDSAVLLITANTKIRELAFSKRYEVNPATFLFPLSSVDTLLL